MLARGRGRGRALHTSSGRSIPLQRGQQATTWLTAWWTPWRARRRVTSARRSWCARCRRPCRGRTASCPTRAAAPRTPRPSWGALRRLCCPASRTFQPKRRFLCHRVSHCRRRCPHCPRANSGSGTRPAPPPRRARVPPRGQLPARPHSRSRFAPSPPTPTRTCCLLRRLMLKQCSRLPPRRRRSPQR